MFCMWMGKLKHVLSSLAYMAEQLFVFLLSGIAVFNDLKPLLLWPPQQQRRRRQQQQQQKQQWQRKTQSICTYIQMIIIVIQHGINFGKWRHFYFWNSSCTAQLRDTPMQIKSRILPRPFHETVLEKILPRPKTKKNCGWLVIHQKLCVLLSFI